jgi:hypothetical protein
MGEFPPKTKIVNIQSVLDFDAIQENFSFWHKGVIIQVLLKGWQELVEGAWQGGIF